MLLSAAMPSVLLLRDGGITACALAWRGTLSARRVWCVWCVCVALLVGRIMVVVAAAVDADCCILCGRRVLHGVSGGCGACVWRCWWVVLWLLWLRL